MSAHCWYPWYCLAPLNIINYKKLLKRTLHFWSTFLSYCIWMDEWRIFQHLEKKKTAGFFFMMLWCRDPSWWAVYKRFCKFFIIISKPLPDLAQKCCRICIVAVFRAVEMSPNNDFHVHRNGKKDFNICVDLQLWHHRRLGQSEGRIMSGGMLREARWGPMGELHFGLGETTGARLSCGDGSSKLFTADRHWWRRSVV